MPPDAQRHRKRALHRRAARHVGRGAHHVLRWIGAVAAVLILVVAFGIWRLLQGPIELNWLTPYVEAGLQRSGIDFTVALSGVRVGIDRATHQLELQADNVRLSRPDGTPLARFPEMTAGFALSTLLHGRLSPTALIIAHPVLHLVRGTDGAVSAQIGSGEAPGLGPHMLERLAGPPEPGAPLALLQRISIRDATLFVNDSSTGRTWRANRVDIAVARGTKGARGDVSFAVPLGDTMPELHASYRFLAARQLLDLHLTIDGVKPDRLPPLIPELAQLRHVAAPVSGTLDTRIDLARGEPEGSRVDLELGRGNLYSDWLPAGGVRIAHGEVHATYAPEHKEVRVANVDIDLGQGTHLAVRGTLDGVTPGVVSGAADPLPGRHMTGQFDAKLIHVPVARFTSLWSPSFYPGARTWALANIRDGVLDQAAVRLNLDLDATAHTASVLSADGRLHYHGLTVTYMPGLPPVRQVAGTATFSGNRLVFAPTGGTLKGLKIAGGTLAISDLDGHTQWLTIDLGVVGPVKDALEVINARPLRYSDKIGIDPDRAGGRAETRLHFHFPLLADLKLAAIDYSAKATINGGALPDLALGHGIRGGRFSMALDKTGAELRGAGLFAGVPAQLRATLPFSSNGGRHATFRVGMTLDAAAQRRLGIDVAPSWLSGPIAIDATYAAFAPHRGEANAVLDLRSARLAVPEAGWEKPIGQPGTARIVLDLANHKIARVRQIAVSAAGLDGRMTARLGPDNKTIAAVLIERLHIGDDVFDGTIDRQADGGWRADIHAARADATHMLKDAMTARPADASPPLAVTMRIDRLIFGEGRELHQVSAQLRRSGGIWSGGRIVGQFPDGRPLVLQFGQTGGGLTLQSDDFGATLKLLDIADNVVGGKLRVDGRMTEVGNRRVLRAHVNGENYVVMRAPALTRLLALPSLTGLASTLSGSGLPFIALRGDIEYSIGRITLNRLLAYGESLGITAKGAIDTVSDRLELHGTVAPAYALNSIVGSLPIIGRLFGGGSQGLFAADYRIDGTSSNPKLSVNPLSALAPGFLRQLFAPFGGTPGAQLEPPTD